ncbi:MAG: hypothetical protein A3G49_04600 [Candidatus Sungbacteria bacterium RIFCSPLOWO2_12_FULL_41_11]|uniref:Methyltransferase domain-containing protein n=1 Tax=Candidatus Sungbacteria bacterium RIFCSPLOWO2_12_FULL_41_11 TaxID=1802286 RepID=A0A1G2LQH7_9BACT|nr:MAG: Methyltransferase type 11 [Parcubacteria group bacterium GW2011_GWA2_42_14]OGZ98921.1 MAG: hypothetical protein A3D41_02130 [Candidatus Sungbacteria bacterium RIFCSPHIGHO2_02_FULL_41_12b]OHA13857.1 MAG: hypothetical protein A3G49_04600 [Candidatus Sungbacteria bacterium RIFCSPLOWO2_12_FULL_41_11]
MENTTAISQVSVNSAAAKELTKNTGFLNPGIVVREFDLKPGEAVADFGAGAGHFTIPMAKAVGHTGKIYALDLQKHALNLIKSRAKIEHLLNIDYVWADLEMSSGSKLKDATVNFVIISNILFQAEKRFEILKEAYRILKSGGKMAVFEWDQSNFSGGPPVNLRVPPIQVKTLAQDAGFIFEKEFNAGSHHYGFLFKKP